MTYEEYVNLVTLQQSITSIDFGDSPEDGDTTVLPEFTGGNANLFPDEFSGRHGETIKSAAEKINSNFTSLMSFIAGYKSLLEDAIFKKRNIYYNIDSSSVSSTLSSGYPAYYSNALSAYAPCTTSIINNDVDVLGIYIFRDDAHRIYTHGYIDSISTGLSAGYTYGLLNTNDIQLYKLQDSYSYIIEDNIIPIYKAVSDTDAILLPYRPIGNYSAMPSKQTSITIDNANISISLNMSDLSGRSTYIDDINTSIVFAPSGNEAGTIIESIGSSIVISTDYQPEPP
jgi:hypothetical protein